jgi:lycopene cyclase domain-containing protein
VPYSSLFIYEVLNVYIKRDFIGKSSRYVIIVIITLLLAIAVTNYDRLYTFYSFILLALTLFIMQFIFKVGYMGRFLFGYTIILIPLLIVNSILTGSFLQEPVVIYNDDENLGLKVFTIPVEDFLYGMLLILINISITEKLRNR